MVRKHQCSICKKEAEDVRELSATVGVDYNEETEYLESAMVGDIGSDEIYCDECNNIRILAPEMLKVLKKVLNHPIIIRLDCTFSALYKECEEVINEAERRN